MTRKVLAAATILTAWAVVLLVALLVAVLFAGGAHAAASGAALPVTGKSTPAFLLGALVLVVSGGILVRLRRRLS